jgi:3-deoxy-7-phosphoheptulonate synthase
MGKISLICRFGHLKIKNELPKLIKIIKDKKLNVVWICDPMHGNTFSIGNKKTRSLLHIKSEISDFFEIHNNCGTIAAGIHLEMTHKNVTECIDHDDNNLNTNYESLCDPRLNGKQSLDIVFSIANNFL